MGLDYKHFVGGFAVGWFVGVFIPKIPNWLVGLAFGLAAWGLLP